MDNRHFVLADTEKASGLDRLEMVVRIRKKAQSSRDIFLILCKWVAGAFYLYLGWYSVVFGKSDFLLYGLFALLTILVGLFMIIQKQVSFNSFPRILRMFFLYAAYSLLSGFFVATNRDVLFSSVVTFIAFSVVCAEYWYISDASGSSNWLLTTMIICALLCAVQAIFFGVEIKNQVNVIAMSLDDNPNTLALTLFLGIFATLVNREKVERHFLSRMAMTCLFYYAIILSGSRKGFLISSCFLVFWFLMFLKKGWKREVNRKMLTNAFILLITLIVAIVAYGKFFSGTAIHDRLEIMKAEGTDNLRFYFYREAFEFW